MASYKCKMCGGTLEVRPGESVCECEYCGTKQTIPSVMEENLQNLFNRANVLRMKAEFDKAAEIYERIVQADESEAEAYWGLVLCKYGVEYVEDPSTFQRIPTCHRTSYEAVTADADYRSAIEHADASQRQIYESEARTIDEIQKGILAVAKRESPYDVFICYKEADENGKRTVDSTIANDIYYQLTQEGFKVFYSAITLEDKLGEEYEPYIFSALNSAKVMLVLGTKPEYFTAVWVKNEWSRFLKLMQNDRSRTLIPCFRDMDAYELPEEFAHLQAEDMTKIGFMNDIIRGIKKLIAKPEDKLYQSGKANITNTTSHDTGNNDALLKRAFMFLEDQNWERADEYCEKVLDEDPENPQAYLGKLLAELEICSQEDLLSYVGPLDEYDNYKKSVKFAGDNLQRKLKEINETCTNALTDEKYNEALQKYNAGSYSEAMELFDEIIPWKDSKEMIETCKNALTDEKYNEASQKYNAKSYSEAMELFDEIIPWKDSKEMREKSYQAEIQYLTKKRKHISHVDGFICVEGGEVHNIIGLQYDGKIIACYSTKSLDLVSTWRDIIALSGSPVTIVGLRFDGTVVALESGNYGQCDVDEWSDVVAVSAGLDHTIGLKSDGTVVATGSNKYGQCDVSGWRDIIAVSAGWGHTIGLNSDGTVVSTGENQFGQCDVSGWRDIIAVSAGSSYTVGLNSDGTVVATGVNYNGQCDVSGWRDIIAVSAGTEHTIGLKTDGTVVATGVNQDGRCNVSRWRDIIAVSAGPFYTVGLKTDGTMVATGDNQHGQCDVSGWRDIIAISAGALHTVGLKSDGTVVATGVNYNGQCDVSGWRDIIAVSAGYYNTIGLKHDGTTLVATAWSDVEKKVGVWRDITAISAGQYRTVGLKSDGTVAVAGKNNDIACDVSGWRDIVAVSVGKNHTVGVKSDGTVIAVGKNKNGECEVSEWRDIVAVSAGENHTVGVKSDGTVIATGDNQDGQCNVSGWRDIIAVSAGENHTVGVKSDGTVVATGDNLDGQCNVSGWQNIIAILAWSHITVGLKADGRVKCTDNGFKVSDLVMCTDFKSLTSLRENEKKKEKEEIDRKIKQCEEEKSRQDQIINENKYKLFGKGAALRKEAKAKFDDLEREISKLMAEKRDLG